MDPQTTLASIRDLPLNERAELVCRLWDQLLEDGWIPGGSEEFDAEIDRRLAAFDSDPTIGLSWDQVVEGLGESK